MFLIPKPSAIRPRMPMNDINANPARSSDGADPLDVRCRCHDGQRFVSDADSVNPLTA